MFERRVGSHEDQLLRVDRVLVECPRCLDNNPKHPKQGEAPPQLPWSFPGSKGAASSFARNSLQHSHGQFTICLPALCQLGSYLDGLFLLIRPTWIKNRLPTRWSTWQRPRQFTLQHCSVTSLSSSRRKAWKRQWSSPCRDGLEVTSSNSRCWVSRLGNRLRCIPTACAKEQCFLTSSIVGERSGSQSPSQSQRRTPDSSCWVKNNALTLFIFSGL